MLSNRAVLMGAQNGARVRLKEWRANTAAHLRELKAMRQVVARMQHGSLARLFLVWNTSIRDNQRAQEKAMAAMCMWRMKSMLCVLRLWNKNTRTGVQETVNDEKVPIACGCKCCVSLPVYNSNNVQLFCVLLRPVLQLQVQRLQVDAVP